MEEKIKEYIIKLKNEGWDNETLKEFIKPEFHSYIEEGGN